MLFVTTPNRRIIYVSQPYEGSCHDFTMFKQAFDPVVKKLMGQQQQVIDKPIMLADSGFQGLQRYSCLFKKVYLPRKSSKHKCLTELDKCYNKLLSRQRVYIEHAIGGLKHFFLLRNQLRRTNWVDYNKIIGVCAGICNFKLSYS